MGEKLDFIDCKGGLNGGSYGYYLKDIYLDGSSYATTTGTVGINLKDGERGYRFLAENVRIEGYYRAVIGGVFRNLQIGQTTATGLMDIATLSRGVRIICKGVKADESKIDARVGYEEEIFIEDLNTPGNNIWISGFYKVSRTANYTGNASDSVKVEPRTQVSPEFLNAFPLFEWKITNVSAAEHTVKVYVKGSGWTTFPTADELYIEVEYYDEATGTHTATAKSSEVLDANDTWKAFTVTFTPAQDGDIYVRGYLKKYEDGDEVVWFNGEVEIT